MRRSAGWLGGRSVGRLISPSVGWLVGVRWSVGPSVGWSVGQFFGQLDNLLVGGRSVSWLVGVLVSWPAHMCLIG